MLHKNSPINTHPRYDNPAKGPRAVVRFFVVANVACSHCLLQNISACISPYGLAQQTQVLQEGHFTPYDHVFTLCQQMHTEPAEMLTIWLVSPKNRPTFWRETKKPTEPFSTFGSQPWYQVYIRGMAAVTVHLPNMIGGHGVERSDYRVGRSERG